MKILLTTLNSQYVHSNPAIKYLYTVTANTPAEISICEFTINNEPSYVFGEIMRSGCDMACFSCYVWNIEQTKAIASDLKKAKPEMKICLGGPEVSFDGPVFARENPWVDYILQGEGEIPFFRLVKMLETGTGVPESVPGLIYRKNKKIYVNVPEEPPEFKRIPFMYSVLECEQDKVIYYESSRGCPFRCAYCLSAIDKRIRALDVDRVKSELRYFLYKKVMQVKFIDRTFNYDADRAYEILKYIIDNDNGVTNFHFEICADLMTPELIGLLSKARKGLFQLEIGIQTLNTDALRAVNRNTDVASVLMNAKKIVDIGNVHVHVDLIAGLPFETYNSFAKSFNAVYKLGADAFQLGFLKVLKGTPLAQRAEEYGIVYRERAPYEIICSRWLSAEELVKLKAIENMLNVYYNRGGFDRTLEYMMETLGTEPFALFERISDFYYDGGYQNKNRKKEEQYRILRKFALSAGFSHGTIEKVLESDMRVSLNAEEVKRFLKKGWEI